MIATPFTFRKVSIILPTFNEGQSIIRLIEAIHQCLLSYPHEIIVVDDNSPDGTYEIVFAYQAEHSFVTAIKRQENPSLALSIQTGLLKASGDAFVIMDSDFNHQPSYLPFMVDSLKSFDCVTASRFLYGGSMNNRLRHLLSWLFNLFTRSMTGGQITDSLYGYLAVRRVTMESCDYKKIFWGYGDYCIRLLYFLQKKRAAILQYPAENGRRLAGVGNRHFFRVFYLYTKEVFKLFLTERALPYVNQNQRLQDLQQSSSRRTS